jgi:hypothetical protein
MDGIIKSVDGMTGNTSFTFRGTHIEFVPDYWHHERFKDTESLCFDHCSMSVVPPGLESLKKLVSVSFISCDQLDRIPADLPASVRRFMMSKCPNVKKLRSNKWQLTHVTIEECATLSSISSRFVCPDTLVSFVVRRCPDLACVPDIFDKTDNIKTVMITECPSLLKMPGTFKDMSCKVDVKAWSNGQAWPSFEIIRRGPRSIRNFISKNQT